MLAIRSNIPSSRRYDIENDADVLACKIRPKSRKKILAVILYRPPNSSLQSMRELKKLLLNGHRAAFDQIIILGDFNLPYIDWTSHTPLNNDALHVYFTNWLMTFSFGS